MNVRKQTVAMLAPLCVLLGALALWCAPALAARGHFFETSFAEKGVGPGQLDKPAGVAVNEATGQVYVVDKGNNRVEYFSSAGLYEGEFNGSGLLLNEGSPSATGQFSEPDGIAVDNSCALHTPQPLTGIACEESDPSNGDVYVVDVGHNVIDKFEAAGKYVGQITEVKGVAFTEMAGVGVDTTGALWVYLNLYPGLPTVVHYSSATSNEFVETVSLEDFQGSAFPRSGFALSSKDDLYVTLNRIGEEGARIAKYAVGGKVLSTEVGSELSTAVAVEQTSNDVYIDNARVVNRYSSDGSLLESLGSSQLAGGGGAGVAVDSLNETVYVADSAADTVYVYAPQAPSTPTVESQSVSAVTGSTATLVAQVNSRGASATADFEYGPCQTPTTCASSTYANSTAPEPAGSGFELATVGPAHLQGLRAGTVYHFRVNATNALGSDGEAPEQTFTTQTAGTFALPDGREWEMVSSPDKQGALLEPIGIEGVIQASANGDAFTYIANAPTEQEPPGFANREQVFSTRGPQGWSSQDISAPHDVAIGPATGQGFDYRAFSSDLSQGLAEPQGEFTPLKDEQGVSEEESPQATERTEYLRHNFACVEAPSKCYRALVTAANVPPGTKFGGSAQVNGVTGPVYFRGGTPDLSHVVLESNVPLAETTPAPKAGGLYEWFAGKLELISLLPENGGPATAPSLAEGDRWTKGGAISNDGARIIWDETGGGKHLYMRDVTKAETVQLDAVEEGASGAHESIPSFQAASTDGSRVFFTDGQQLTRDSGASGTSERGQPGDLYECEMVELAGKLKCKLSDLTPLNSGGESAEVQGITPGSAEDGSSVYFVANSRLAESAVRGNCKDAGKAGELCNLYVWHEGTTKLVAVLSGLDSADWHQVGRSSPDGNWLAFMSQRDLTGYDNRDAFSNRADEEVYLYDAKSGRLVCASCDPTGARPVGVEYSHLASKLTGGVSVWGLSTWLAANIPAWTNYNLTLALYQSRYLSNGGRLFFNSSDGLVSQDTNGTEDVYEYEPAGVPAGGSACTTSSTTFSERADGCIALISSGISGEESAFLDASETGGDVFFLTSAKLSAQDTDTSLDVYDAQECTSAEPCLPTPAVSPPPCSTGDSCKAAPTPQPSLFGQPATETFSGAGNTAPARSVVVGPKAKPLSPAQKLARALKACRSKPARGRAACRALARRRYRAAREHRTGSTNRRVK